MTWEEHLETLNKSTIKELDDKIKELTDENNDRACQAMNEIHWVLALVQTNKQKIEKIEELEKEYHNQSFGPILSWRLKHMKEEYEKDPEAYKAQWEDAQEFAEKLRANNFNGSNTNDL